MIINKLPSKLRKNVIAKLLEHLQTDNYAKLSRVLGCNSRQHLDNCFARGNIPTNRIINYALKEGIDLNWLFGQSNYGTSIIDTKEHQELQKQVNKTYRKLIGTGQELKED